MPLPIPFELAPLLQAEPQGLPKIIDNLARTPLSQVVLLVGVLTVARVLIAPTLAKTPPHLRMGGYRALRFANELFDAIVYAGVFVFLIIRPFGVQAFRIPSGSMWPTLYVNDFVVANKAIYRYSDPQKGDVVVFRPPPTAVTDPKDLDEDGQAKLDFIKRCVGVPGDVVELKDGLLYINGQRTADPTKHYSKDDNPPLGQTFSPVPPEDVPKASFKLVRDDKGRIIPFNYTADTANSGQSYVDGKVVGGDAYQVSSDFALGMAEGEKLKQQKPQPVPPGFYLMMGDNRNNSFDGRGWGLVPRASIIGRSEFIWLPISRIGRTPSVDIVSGK